MDIAKSGGRDGQEIGDCRKKGEDGDGEGSEGGSTTGAGEMEERTGRDGEGEGGSRTGTVLEGGDRVIAVVVIACLLAR